MSFIHEFEAVCEMKGFNCVERYKLAGIGKDRYSDIMTRSKDPNYQCPRKPAIALCMALELSLDEVQQVLSKAGHLLSHELPRDQIVMNAIKRREYGNLRLRIDFSDAGIEY